MQISRKPLGPSDLDECLNFVNKLRAQTVEGGFWVVSVCDG